MSDLLRQRLIQWTKTAAGCEIPIDTAARAHWAVKVLRGFIEETCSTIDMDTDERKILDYALIVVGFRCAAADELEEEGRKK